eukprot:ANDGO_05205.mRNA.1 hypothetical protein
MFFKQSIAAVSRQAVFRRFNSDYKPKTRKCIDQMAFAGDVIVTGMVALFAAKVTYDVSSGRFDKK